MAHLMTDERGFADGTAVLPPPKAFISHDLCEVRDRIAKTYCPHDLHLSSRSERLSAWLNHRQLKKLGVATMGYGANVQIERVQDENMLLLMLPLAGSAEIGSTQRIIDSNVRRASVIDSAELRHMRWSGECVQRVVQISNNVLEHHAMMLMGRPLSQKLRFAEEMSVDAQVASCWHYAQMLTMEIEQMGEGAAKAVIDNLETLLIFKLLESQPSNYSEHMHPQPCKIAPHHVRRVEQYILAHADQHLTLEQLVDVSGVSARALFDGFRRFRGTYPMAYLKSVRLERAREDLLQAGPTDTVTNIACRWGFYQFGRFAAQYKSMFGELPSETIRKFN